MQEKLENNEDLDIQDEGIWRRGSGGENREERPLPRRGDSDRARNIWKMFSIVPS